MSPTVVLVHGAFAVSDLVGTVEGPVVLAGHSYGGAVISNVDADAGEIVGLVYVNGFAQRPAAQEALVHPILEAAAPRVALHDLQGAQA